ncbi:B-cell receptor CD22-like isoform X2 [Patella vulgata]|uniref:B-cell receptor CD22-like isoform X2 n=1 Tax=Patella vulgata TaxID=6465 RepID=UPI0024A7DA49|nr:B-cell receptor CD22-like isoform X2 [Patella vulgata]
MQSDLKLTCSVDSNPEPSNYQWYNPDGSYAAVTRYLDLSNISKNQGGDYKCETMTKLVPTNGDPITKMHSKIFHVNVLYAPKDESLHEIVNVTVNSNVMLNCSVDSNPQPSSYKWYSPGGTVKLYTRDLLISNIKKTDGGDYRCEAVIVLVPTEGEPITKMYTHITTVNILSSLGHGEQGVRGQPKINTTNMKTVGLGVGISAAIIVIIVVVVIAAVCYRKRHVRGQNRELNRFHNAPDARPFAGIEVSTIAGQSSENPYAVLYDNRQDGNTAREISVIESPTNGSEEEHPYDTVTCKQRTEGE